MAEVKTTLNNWTRLLTGQRRSAVAPRDTTFSPTEGCLSSIEDNGEPTSSIPLSDLSQKPSSATQLTTTTTVLNTNDNVPTTGTTQIPISPLEQAPLVQPSTNHSNSKPHSSDSNCTKQCNTCSASMQKSVCILIIVVLVITCVAAAIAVSVNMFKPREIRIEASGANITASVCSTATCIGQETPHLTTMNTIIYLLDGNTNDISGYATGNLFGNPIPTYTSSCYIGSFALSLLPSAAQYVQIPYVNLAESFTMEVWLFPQTSLAGDYGIFGQCDANLKCFSLSLRNGRIALSFDALNTTNNTLTSASLVTLADWTHITVTYNATLAQQQIYINGRIDATSIDPRAPYAGTALGSVTTIGRSISFAYGLSYFQGRIDHFTIAAGVIRTPCQIYNDASLLAYYSFDPTSVFTDNSVNLFQGMGSGVSPISDGYFIQALYFSSNTSYFQVKCFPSPTTSIIAFSISLWIKPDNITRGGTLVHVSNLQTGNGSCYDLLSFNARGGLIVQLMQSTTIVNGTEGPIIPANVWTHVAVVFGPLNGLRLYVDGLLRTVSVGASQGSNGVVDPQFITIGNISPLGSSASLNCRNGSVPTTPGAYRGAIDEFRFYNRALDNQEICILANM